jgi:arylsulfatase A-like enzyme
MRVLYIDIDALRPDHLGCYGYHRNTSPHIDRLAEEGCRFDQLYCSDAPCMPSRTALFSGRFGARTGAVAHAGTVADPFPEGPGRGFTSKWGRTSWMQQLADAGFHTASISSFGQRHSAFHWYAGFREVLNTGGMGMESAEEVAPAALDWLDRRGADDPWFLHLNFWDAHTPYRVPEAFGNPFAGEPLPDWLTEELRRSHWEGVGMQSARERSGFGGKDYYNAAFPRQPAVIDSMDAVRAMFDGYDCGIRWVDTQIGHILDKLESLGVLDETAVIISADHGENLGELNIYGCHQTADPVTMRLPCIIRWPGLTTGPDAPAPRTDGRLRYHFDFAATVLDLVGADIPDNWDGRSFASLLRGEGDTGREHLVLSQGQGSCQRAVRFDDWYYMRTYHDGYRDLPDDLLWHAHDDPHLLENRAPMEPGIVAGAKALLADWESRVVDPQNGDPLQTVIAEGGPPHVRGQLEAYVAYLRETGRAAAADRIEARHRRQGAGA